MTKPSVPKKTSKQKSKKKPKQPLVETVTIELTKPELVHVRDMLSVLVPNDPPVTISEVLARRLDKVGSESSLWAKVVLACADVGVSCGKDTQDYVVMNASQPALDVFAVDVVTTPDEPGVGASADE